MGRLPYTAPATASVAVTAPLLPNQKRRKDENVFLLTTGRRNLPPGNLPTYSGIYTIAAPLYAAITNSGEKLVSEKLRVSHVLHLHRIRWEIF